ISFSLLDALRHHRPDYACRWRGRRVRICRRIRGIRGIRVYRRRWSRLSRHSQLSTAKDFRAPQLFIQCNTRSSFPSTSSALRNYHLRISSHVPAITTERQLSASLRLSLDHSPRNSFIVETAPSSIGITKISPRHACYATPRFVIRIFIRASLARIIMTASTTAAAVTWSTIVVTVIMRVWIVVVIRQRIPADVLSERDVDYERDQRRPPPTAIAMESAARDPRPVVVV